MKFRQFERCISGFVFMVCLLIPISGSLVSAQISPFDKPVASHDTGMKDTGDAETQMVISGDLSLEDAVKIALVHNRSLQAVLRDRDIAEGQITEAYGYVFPFINLEGSYSRLDEIVQYDTGDSVVEMGSLNNYSVALKVVQPVYHGGALSAGIRAAKLYRSLADANVQAGVQEVLYDTVQLYYQAVLAMMQSEVQSEFVALAEEHVNDVKAKLKYGMASQFNVLRAEVELSNSRAQLVVFQNSFHQARHSFFQSIGVSQSSDVQLTDDLAYTKTEEDEAHALSDAFRLRPDLAGAHLMVGLQTEAVNNAKSDYWPDVDAFYNYNVARPDPLISTLDKWGTTWVAGLSIRMDLFALSREGRISQERARLGKQKIQLLDRQEAIRFEVRRSLSSLQDADAYVAAQKLTVDQANEGLRLAEVGYREGTLDQVSVLEARAALNQARMLYWSSLYNHTLACLTVQLATGRLCVQIIDGR